MLLLSELANSDIWSMAISMSRQPAGLNMEIFFNKLFDSILLFSTICLILSILNLPSVSTYIDLYCIGNKAQVVKQIWLFPEPGAP